ncbi:ComEC/Rec2 family competence protein [Stieleria sp. TO1_6]|uniref:ComEC/Rec2 family competence protein n=1 Tax=Stieleria tagensis TaxID=2956795 RepID=UPI00209A6BE9|nr:ComEC/Rec2 family competence protein [Stieleria tagensis]MCO8121721.1 ComEC/Rec2 family competence protein [Stieleria tagensis]
MAAWLHRFPFVVASSLAILGVVCDALWFESFSSSAWRWSILSALAIALPLSLSVAGLTIGRSWCWASSALLWICFFGTLHAWQEQSYRDASVLALVDQPSRPVVVRGTLSRTVSLRPNPLARSRARDQVSPWQSQLTVQLDQIRGQNGFSAIDGAVLVYVDGDLSDRRPGDRLEIYGWLHRFDGPTNPGQPDLRPSYRRRNLHGRIETKNAAAVTLIQASDRPLASAVASIATAGRESLLRHCDDRTGPLAVALVVGQREFVDANTRDALLATGTAHLLSVSGMHLAILVLVATWCVSGLGLRPTTRLVVIVTVSGLYVAVTGGRPPVMRAAILIAMLLLSTCFRRTSQPINTLAVAALLLTFINPMNVFAVGVHLSFLAVITLMLAGRPIVPGSMRTELELQQQTGFQTLVDASSGRFWMHTKSVLRFFGQMAWLSGCVTAISLPLVWSQFHLVSLVSVITNVMVWGGLMLALPAGVMTVILDPIHSWLGAIPGTICHLSLAFMWWVIEWTERWPGGHLWLPAPRPPLVVGFYLVMAFSLIWRSPRARWFRGAWFLVWSLGALFVVTRPAELPAETLEATFVDVGHGTSVILRSPTQQVWLYDCGRLGNSLGSSRDIDTALWSLGVTRIDGVFLSHADSDHYNALPGLLERFDVAAVITPPGLLEKQERGLTAVRSALDRHRVQVVELAAGQSSPFMADPAMSIMHPPPGGIRGSDNANSLVLRFDQGDKTLLLPGDLEPPGTELLTARPRPPADGVLMAPHHGSLSMDADQVLAWSRPAETIVSGSDRAARVEIREMLSVTGSGVHVTAKSGAVRVRVHADGHIQVRSWLTAPW